MSCPLPGLRLGRRQRREPRVVARGRRSTCDVVLLTPARRPRRRATCRTRARRAPTARSESDSCERAAGVCAERPGERGGNEAPADDERGPADRPRVRSSADRVRPSSADASRCVVDVLTRRRHRAASFVRAKTAYRGHRELAASPSRRCRASRPRRRSLPRAVAVPDAEAGRTCWVEARRSLYETSSADVVPISAASGVEAEDRDVARRRDVGRQQLRRRRPPAPRTTSTMLPPLGSVVSRHELQHAGRRAASASPRSRPDGRVILRSGVVLRRDRRSHFDRAVEAELRGADLEPGVLERAQRRLRHPRPVRPEARLEAGLALEGRARRGPRTPSRRAAAAAPPGSR